MIVYKVINLNSELRACVIFN